jgi:hypothetical protein
MKSILFALAVTAASVVPAHAVLVGLLLPFHATSEMVVGIVSRCGSTASYRLVVRNALNDTVLYAKAGRLAAGRGVALPWSLGGLQHATMLRVGVKWECSELDAARQRPPLVGVTVRDLTTKVPQYMGFHIEIDGQSGGYGASGG